MEWGLIEVLVIEADLSDLSSDTATIDSVDTIDPDELDWSSASSYDVDVIEITEEGLILPLENPMPIDKEPSLFFAFSLPPGAYQTSRYDFRRGSCCYRLCFFTRRSSFSHVLFIIKAETSSRSLFIIKEFLL